jgi:uncharacterized membrane protein YccC
MIGAMVDEVFDTIERSNADTNAAWATALVLATVTLRLTDEFNRERLLRGVERSLREDLVKFEQMLEAKNASPGDAA